MQVIYSIVSLSLSLSICVADPLNYPILSFSPTVLAVSLHIDSLSDAVHLPTFAMSLHAGLGHVTLVNQTQLLPSYAHYFQQRQQEQQQPQHSSTSLQSFQAMISEIDSMNEFLIGTIQNFKMSMAFWKRDNKKMVCSSCSGTCSHIHFCGF